MNGKFDIKRAGTRVRIVRHATSQSRAQLCKAINISPHRLRNLEGLRQKLNEEDFQALQSHWPIFIDFIISDQKIRLDPSNDYIREKVSAVLLEHPDKLAEAQTIKEIAGIDLVRAALTLPNFRKIIHKSLDKIMNLATRDALLDAR